MENKIRRELNEKTSELKIIVPVAEKEWLNQQKIAFNNLAKKVKVPGFRPGKAPEKELKRHVNQRQVWQDAISKLINPAAKEAAEQLTETDIVLEAPSYSIEEITENSLQIGFIYPLFPKLKIENYDKLQIKFEQPDQKAIKANVAAEIDKLLLKGSLLLPKEGPEAKIEKDDTIIFDFKGFLNGKAFKGGEAEKHELKIGSNTFIPGFEDQLLGKPLGWQGEIKVTFPAEYYKEEFRNQEAQFKIKIHEIKYNDKPKLDEQYIKSLNIPNVNNEKELNDYLLDLSKRELIEKARTQFMEQFFAKIMEQNEIPVPESLIFKETNKLFDKFKDGLKQQEVSEKEYYELTGYNEEKVKAELRIEAQKVIKKEFLLTHFIRELKIKATEEDLLRQYQRLAKLYGIDGQTIQTFVKDQQIEPQVINELIIDALIKSNNPDLKIAKEAVTISRYVAPEPAKTETSTNLDEAKEIVVESQPSETQEKPVVAKNDKNATAQVKKPEPKLSVENKATTKTPDKKTSDEPTKADKPEVKKTPKA